MTAASAATASVATLATSAATGPRTPQGKAASARNATTHGLFARDVVLPALGEDPEGYRRLEAEWLAQLPPRTLLERHYVEKIAAASWRLRRLQRWQARIFEDDALTEPERLDRLDKALRHETALQRQIDTAVKMLGKDAPQLYARRVRDEVLEEAMTSERECRDSARDETEIDLETRGRLRRIRKATEAAVEALSQAPLDTGGGENCQNGPPIKANEAAGRTGGAGTEANGNTEDEAGTDEGADEADENAWEPPVTQNCRNEPSLLTSEDRRAFLGSFPSMTAPPARRSAPQPQRGLHSRIARHEARATGSGRLQIVRRELPDQRRLVRAEGRFNAEQATPAGPDGPPVLGDDALHALLAELEEDLTPDPELLLRSR